MDGVDCEKGPGFRPVLLEQMRCGARDDVVDVPCYRIAVIAGGSHTDGDGSGRRAKRSAGHAPGRGRIISAVKACRPGDYPKAAADRALEGHLYLAHCSARLPFQAGRFANLVGPMSRARVKDLCHVLLSPVLTCHTRQS